MVHGDLTAEQIADRESVWAELAVKCPKFTRAHDPTDNWHAIREIILGGSLTWQGANERFKPFPGARVMDIGASVGIFSAYCALEGAMVFAYEPDAFPFMIMEQMLFDTGLRDKVLPIVWAVADGYGAYKFRTSFKDQFLREAACIPFEDAIEEMEWDCVKMDVEGAEYDIVLGTSLEALKKIKFMFVEFHPWVKQGKYNRTIERLESVFFLEGLPSKTFDILECAWLTRR